MRGQIVDLRMTAASLNGTPVDDRYFGTRFDDRLSGGAGNDTIVTSISYSLAGYRRSET